MFQKPRGTQDLFKNQADLYEWIVLNCINVVKNYKYEFIRTPIFEEAELFLRSIGNDTDIVNKELYLIKSLNENNHLALRPEGTASILRSVIENKLFQNNLLKFFYYGPMFRYERPQKGRYREFYQFGVEAIGINSPILDAEVILMAINILKKLNINDLNLKINSLGKLAERKEYLIILTNYLSQYKDQLCPLCQERLKNNPLRILDCKEEENKDFIKNAPKLLDYLSETSKKDFAVVLNILKANNINYEISSKLVRGIDYYEDTIFEINATSGLGAKTALLGGGRYNKLGEILGSKNALPSVGFAFGIERLAIFLEQSKNLNFKIKYVDCYFIALSDEVEIIISKIWIFFTQNNLKCERSYSYNFKNQLSKANKAESKYLLIIGKNNLEEKTFTLQNNLTGNKKEILLDDIALAVKIIQEKSF